MTKSLIAVSLLACVLGGCAPSASQLANADYGPPISQARAEQIAEALISSNLKDPASARFTWFPIEKGWAFKPWYMGYKYGYKLEGFVNAKNSFGAYAGKRDYWVLFRGEKVVGAGLGL
ncbi:MAG: hypothetical protein ED559_08360 [Phycisphaera sp.]|nr:MAG: hypothetical protein ED559_08360 [Phycisphaera sp.]